MIRSRFSAIRSLTLLDMVQEGEPYAFVCYGNGDNYRWWHRFLKIGFRHCFVIYWDGQMWMRLEKLYGCFTAVSMVYLDGFFVGRFNLESYFVDSGYTVQVLDLSKRYSDKVRVKHLLAPNTCVEFVKDFAGIRNAFVNTPFQLFSFIEGDKHG